jgi:hypothetical protein
VDGTLAGNADSLAPNAKSMLDCIHRAGGLSGICATNTRGSAQPWVEERILRMRVTADDVGTLAT